MGSTRYSGLDWYFDLQLMLGGQPGNPVLRTIPMAPEPETPQSTRFHTCHLTPTANGRVIAPGSNGQAAQTPTSSPTTCPPGELRCPLHARVQVALRDSNGNFACFISPPSNAVPLPLP